MKKDVNDNKKGTKPTCEECGREVNSTLGGICSDCFGY